MTTYSIKLADHTDSPREVTAGILGELTGFFNRVFDNTSDDATVAWGRPSSGDAIVLRFVSDISNSYIRQALSRNARISPNAGGHTTLHGHRVCSEFYRTVIDSRGRNRPMSNRDYARLAFHECLHNVFPAWTEHDLMGHGGFAETPVGRDLSQWDIDTLRRGIAIRSPVSQQL